MKFSAWRFLVVINLIFSTLVSAQYPASNDTGKSLKDAVDMHIHTAPDIFGRAINDLEALDLAANRGFRAIVLKNHVSSTAGRAELLNMMGRETVVFGGIVLNRSIGGINPEAVLNMSLLSPDYGKLVWFPTFDAKAHLEAFGSDKQGISILDGLRLNTEVYEVLKIIKDRDLILLTGHLGKDEITTLVSEAKAMGINKIVITHALAETPGLTLTELQSLAKQDVFFELTFLSYLSGPNAHLDFLRTSSHVSIAQMMTAIRAIGADRFILSSDLGQSGNAVPTDGIKQFVDLLLNAGITEGEIDNMIRVNPAFLLFDGQ